MTINENNNFYKQNEKKYIVTNNKKFVKFYNQYLDKKYPNSIIILGENDENIKI